MGTDTVVTYFADVTPYTYWSGVADVVGEDPDGAPSGVLNVGWLSAGVPSRQGSRQPAWSTNLLRRATRPVHVTRGVHLCEFCENPIRGAPLLVGVARKVAGPAIRATGPLISKSKAALDKLNPNALVNRLFGRGGVPPGTYRPARPLPRTKHGDPIPDSPYPHTQLGRRTDNGNTYAQGREWVMENGRLRAKRDFDDLLRRVEALRPGTLMGRWRVQPGARGYGEHVVALDEAVASGAHDVDGTGLFPVLLTDREYLEHGDLKKIDDEGMDLGVFDSAYLYFRGPRALGEQIAAGFEHASVNPRS